jgi:ATP-binding cassette subfamily B protein
MDCGPAALSALLNGCGIDVSYPRLREACQTDVDGTSIDTLEELAQRFGLDAEQIMLPSDFLLDPHNDNLPCIAVVTLPNGLTHFVVIWRAVLGWFEVMDPARGRCWMRRRELDAILYRHELEVAAQDWLEYTGSNEFVHALRSGFRELSMSDEASDALIARVLDTADWRRIRVLDAALRMCRSLDRPGTRVRGHNAATLIEHALQSPELVPPRYFQVAADDAADETLQLRGAVVLKVSGAQPQSESQEPVIRKTLGGFRVSVARRLWEMLRDMGFRHLAVQLSVIAAVMGVLTLVEALVFRYLLGFQAPTELSTYALVLLAVMLPSAGALACTIGQTRFSQVLGRQLETRLRTDLLRKLPRIRDDYFASRLVSDLAERGHAITQLRDAPLIATTLLVDFARIAMVLVGLSWVMSSMLWVVALAGVFAIAAPLGMFGMLAERDLRARTHLGALSNLYLDALRGTEPIWTHGAARSLELEHETLLLRWVRASARLRRAATTFEAVQVLVLAGCGIALVLRAIDQALPQGTVLLVAYWALFVPMLSRGLLINLKQLPAMHNIVRRVLEILDAPEEAHGDARSPDPRARGVRLELQHVSVVRGAQQVLAELDLIIEAGEQIAIVGESGSGKSSFLGALSGWHTVSGGRILVDGDEADAARIQALRQQSALVDPETYLWNREIYANVLYGLSANATPTIDAVLDASELVFDLEKMTDGLATRIGENGSRLSGGESQRLRIARALIRSDARLVLLDEPFSGMDADQRQRMRRHALDRWPDATLLWVSHHVRETTRFPRVLVFERGRIVEDGPPDALLRQASRYAAMIAAEDALQARLREAPWRVVDFSSAAAVSP